MAERKRATIPITGIDTSTPDHSVEDGKCGYLHNLRYTGGAWRNVKEFEGFTIEPMYDYSELDDAAYTKVIYRHQDYLIVYIVDEPRASNEHQHTISAVKVNADGTFDKPLYITHKNFPLVNGQVDTSIHITNLFHFGNMLILSWDNSKEFDYFILDQKKYRPYANSFNLKFSMEESLSLPTSLVKWTKSYTDAGSQQFYMINTWETVAANDSNDSVLVTTEKGMFRGEFAIFAALRSANGSILYRTPIQLYNPTNKGALEVVNGDLEYIYATYGEISKGKRGVIGGEIVDKYVYDNITNDIAPSLCPEPSKLKKVNINFDGTILNDDVYDIAFYSTRLYSLFSVSAQSISINDVDLMQGPFYLLKAIRKDDLQKESGSFVIDADLISNVEHNPLYEATQSNFLYSDKTFEYNNRLHLLGTYISPRKQPIDFLAQDSIIESDKTYRTNSVLSTSYEQHKFYTNIPAPISYAKEQSPIISVFSEVSDLFISNENMEYSNRFSLKYSPVLDVSYYIKRYAGSNLRKYENIVLATDKQGVLDADISTQPILVPNRLQVSELNDPYVYPYENSYRIGTATNEIIAVNSGAIEMSDAKFGEFPVYVFTKEGIFAMQSGTETLYAAIVPINYDVAINPNTLAVNGAVLYFTDKGLHALTNQGAQLLSAPLHTSNNRILEWMRTTQMVYLPEWNEVLCTDLPNRKAYVFSLDSKVWSTRDIPEGYILNNDELVGGNFIYNLRNEKEQGKDSISVSISTRPIKLGSMELKRAETIIVRFECATEQTLLIEVEGSVDTQHWQTLRELEDVKTNKDIIIRRTPCSVKYLKFSIRGEVTDDIRILAFEVEYYHRWMRKMR